MTPMITRRALLATGALGATAAALAPRLRCSPVHAGSSGSTKLLFVFLRGGNDGVNTVVPGHDAEYTQALRPTTWLSPAARLDLNTGGAAFHPALARLKELYDDGDVAVLHRVGYENATLSHFASQHFWETAVPDDPSVTEGFAARWAREFAPGDPLAAVGVSPRLQLAFSGPAAVPHVPDLAQYTLGSGPLMSKLLGSAPGASAAGRGLLGRFHDEPGAAEHDAALRESGQVMGASLAALGALPPHPTPAAWYPTDDATLAAEGLPVTAWARTFFRNLRDATRILVQSGCRLAGVELDGFDHHVSQGGASGAHADLLRVVAHGLRSVRWDAQPGTWDDLVVLVATEFGRTSRENGGQGTDHGKAACLFACGGAVQGGVWNCDPTTWPSGATLFSDNQKYVAHLTDYRAVLAEVFERHLGVPAGQLDRVVPGWSGLSGPAFQPLGFLA